MAVLHAPRIIAEALAQGACDTVNHKGLDYGAGEVGAVVLFGFLADKEISKAKDLTKAAGEIDDVTGGFSKVRVADMADDVSGAAEKTLDDVKFAGEISKGKTGSKFRYEHNPSDNPKVLQDAIEDADAVYGYSPNPNSKAIGEYANSIENKIDWGDPKKVADYQRRRENYHIKNDNIDELVINMKNEGFSQEEIARAVNKQRNQNRLNDYIINNDIEGLERVKRRSFQKYGNEYGLDADDAYKIYGSWEMVIEKSKSANPGMDACCGLYDKYYHLYEMK